MKLHDVKVCSAAHSIIVSCRFGYPSFPMQDSLSVFPLSDLTLLIQNLERVKEKKDVFLNHFLDLTPQGSHVSL